MKEIVKKISGTCKSIFGYGIMICLFAGGSTFFGYLAAIIIGGETAAAICAFLYEIIMPIIIKTSTILVLLGMVAMYLSGEKTLTAGKKNEKKKENG